MQASLSELAAEEWREVVDQARALGTREWAISGGEPMLRPDFAEIFEYVTAKATTYSLNTNGTLITPQIAQLLRHKGSKLIPMRDNCHLWAAMEEVAKSLSKPGRVGAPWLYMSACGGEARNAEIAAQRLDPTDAVALDEPDLSGSSRATASVGSS